MECTPYTIGRCRTEAITNGAKGGVTTLPDMYALFGFIRGTNALKLDYLPRGRLFVLKAQNCNLTGKHACWFRMLLQATMQIWTCSRCQALSQSRGLV
ncbi:hypothetical protein A0H81_06004 [Grifola frondosa]|uniref:Uncharacterized protein n=1 Tax=Grifola frondosa TaxID=5627 RepID=A0A1C7MBC3_GRIFR|nr:hypothetical protein A0H81_06004 [Grifola frondosa]